MTQSINLIPKEEVVEQRKQRVVKLSSVFTVLVLIVTLLVGGYFMYKRTDLNSKIVVEDQEIQNYRTDIQALSEIEITARNLDARYQIIQDVYNTRRNYSILLAELNKRIPSGVKVDSFSLSGDMQNVINLSGKGTDYNAIALILNTLSDNQFANAGTGLGALFSNVTLNSVALDAQSSEVSFYLVVSFDESLIK